ncbi:MAG: glycosyltransferase family 4 protein [Ignavibacteriaceae bacterium]
MKILQLTPEYPPFSSGGVGNSVFEVVNQLKKLGNDVEVIAPNGYPRTNHSNSKVHHIFAAKIKRHWGELAICPTILNDIRQIDFEIAHAHTPKKYFAESIYLFNLLARKKKPYVVSIRLINQSLPPFLSSVADVYRKLVEKKIFKKASNMVVQSELHKHFLINVCGISSSKIAIIPNGVDTTFFDPNSSGHHLLNPGQNSKTILFVGRLTSQKGLDVLLKAIAILIKRNHDLRVMVAGGGPLKSDLEHLCKTLGIQKNVVFLGPVNHSDIPKVYAMADIFVLPSISESFPNTLMEAMAMERPIVATKVGAVPEIIQDGKEALLVLPGDVEGLASSIERLVLKDDLAKNLAKNARELVKKQYTWQSVAKKTLEVYEKILY